MTHTGEIERGERFGFGENWARFLETLTEPQVVEAEKSLQLMLGMPSLLGRTFLDIGSGSGLFSLAARRLGAFVRSFDYDPRSVACTRELKRRLFPDDQQWIIEEGSILDRRYFSRLNQFDIVYSWGVLHHTGSMWEALNNAASRVAAEGVLFIAIYNDQGTISNRWTRIKKLYNRTPKVLRPLIHGPLFVQQYWRRLTKDILLLRPFYSIRRYEGRRRGMTAWRDHIDWVGGYPFEVAKPEEIFDFYRIRGFQLQKLKTCGGTLGCNEFVFRRTEQVATSLED